jgi:hypothetical protein
VAERERLLVGHGGQLAAAEREAEPVTGVGVGVPGI